MKYISFLLICILHRRFDQLWVFSNCHRFPKAVSNPKAALIHGYWDMYLKGTLILCPFSKMGVGLHFGPVDSPAMGFRKDLQYQAWVYPHEEGLKPNQKIFGCPYNNAPNFFFNSWLYFARSNNSLDWENSQNLCYNYYHPFQEHPIFLMPKICTH